MALIDDVKRALRSNFRGAEIHLKRLSAGRRVGGSLIWDGFKGKPQIDRQTKLRRVIERALPPDQQVEVSFILTLTPDEEAVLAEQ